MKKLLFMIGTALVVLSACGPGDKQKDQGLKKDTLDLQNIAIKAPDNVADTLLLIPGKQAGKVHLGQDMQKIFEILGKPADGDAAMGSAMGVWYNPKATGNIDTVTVFSSYRDSTMSVREVKQVSVTSMFNQTEGGVHTGMKLDQLVEIYPDLKLVQRFKKEKGNGELLIYDHPGDGIAFDIVNGICTAITIYPAGKSVNQIYLPARPGWKTSP
ncbi:hypothetical protein [Pedobacter antarcticus]|uniref:hypothetical protein n=1 Tax=Pedobacter antarcticus TaxID=34086 RepID=UPI00088B2D1F|nr:hypothetical protein [Pedobacter antarcticus]SDM29644.1 hypothetical protein SAMN04488084_105159 [Pedobacter antarcticus]